MSPTECQHLPSVAAVSGGHWAGSPCTGLAAGIWLLRCRLASRTTERRRRPKDRRTQIARVSAEAFSELGYHGVSMEDIAGRVGVTAASLYRHYSGKYDLFRAAVLGLGQQLVDCTAFIEDRRRALRSASRPGTVWWPS